jgi:hypothetical protein
MSSSRIIIGLIDGSIIGFIISTVLALLENTYGNIGHMATHVPTITNAEVQEI